MKKSDFIIQYNREKALRLLLLQSIALVMILSALAARLAYLATN
jgi:hypothetical protein